MMYGNKNKFLSVIVGFIIVFALSVSMAQAQTPAGNNTSLQDLVLKLQEQIRALQGQILGLNTKVQLQEQELVAVKLELQFTKNIQRGASGEEVKKLQEFLRSIPNVYPEGVVSGYFGPLTETAVKKFQEKNGIEPVGVIGPKTRAVLNETASGNCSSNTARPCFDRRAGDKIFILNEGSGNNAFTACMNNPSENKTGELLEKTSLCDEEKIQFCYEGQSANLIRKFEGSCQIKPVLRPTPTLPPPSCISCAVPPIGCSYQNQTCTSCGTLVCSTLPPSPPPSPTPTSQPATQPAITVLTPNGGEKILQGSTFTIQWSTTNFTSKSVNIALYQYKGGTWTYWNTIATNVPQGAETGTFSYEWKTLSFDIDRDFYIEVSGAGGYPSPTDKSDQAFHFISNYSVQVITPNGGESWPANSGQLVRWSATRLQNFPTVINLLKGGAIYRTLLSAVFPDYFDGTALVKKLTIPTDVPSGSDYTIEVMVPAIWTTIPEAHDASDKPFSIVSSAVVSPVLLPTLEQTLTVSEQVKCVFKDSTDAQECYSSGSSSGFLYGYSCKGSAACVVDVKGNKGDVITWKSSCGGYAHTTVDGINEYAEFSCAVMTPQSSPPPPSPTVTTTIPVAPTDLKITNGYAPGVEPPKMHAQLSFKYTLQADSRSINIYVKKPTDAEFIRYTHDAQLTAKGYTQVGESYMSYIPNYIPTPTWAWELVPLRSSSGWPVGTYKYYLTTTNTSGIESIPSPELTFTVIAPPIITYPTNNQTISLPFTITVKDPTGLSCANAHAQIYRANSTSVLWEKAFCSLQVYDGSALNADGNPYRIVVHGSALGGVYMSQIVLNYFNMP